MIEERRIDILGMAETRHWGKDEGKDQGGGYILMYRGTEEGGGRHGVAIVRVVGPRLSHYIQESKLINETVMRCTMEGRRYNI